MHSVLESCNTSSISVLHAAAKKKVKTSFAPQLERMRMHQLPIIQCAFYSSTFWPSGQVRELKAHLLLSISCSQMCEVGNFFRKLYFKFVFLFLLP